MARATTHRLPEGKTAEEILSPAGRTFEAAGRVFEIYPLPDGVFMTVADSLGEVTGAVMGLNERRRDPETGKAADLTSRDVLPLLPLLIRSLLPSATRIIAGALREKPEWVAENVGLAKKLEALRLILEAEDIAAIVANFQALTAIFPAIPAASEAEPGADEGPGTGD